MYGTVPMLIVPGGPTATDTGAASPSPNGKQPEQGRGLSAAVATAAVMSSQVGHFDCQVGVSH
jgi:hypothetical protein